MSAIQRAAVVVDSLSLVVSVVVPAVLTARHAQAFDGKAAAGRHNEATKRWLNYWASWAAARVLAVSPVGAVTRWLVDAEASDARLLGVSLLGLFFARWLLHRDNADWAARQLRGWIDARHALIEAHLDAAAAATRRHSAKALSAATVAAVAFARDHAHEAWLILQAYAGAQRAADELCSKMRDYKDSQGSPAGVVDAVSTAVAETCDNQGGAVCEATVVDAGDDVGDDLRGALVGTAVLCDAGDEQATADSADDVLPTLRDDEPASLPERSDDRDAPTPAPPAPPPPREAAVVLGGVAGAVTHQPRSDVVTHQPLLGDSPERRPDSPARRPACDARGQTPGPAAEAPGPVVPVAGGAAPFGMRQGHVSTSAAAAPAAVPAAGRSASRAPPPARPGFRAPPPAGPGLRASPPPAGPGLRAPPPARPGLRASPPPARPVLRAPPPARPGFRAPPPVPSPAARAWPALTKNGAVCKNCGKRPRGVFCVQHAAPAEAPTRAPAPAEAAARAPAPTRAAVGTATALRAAMAVGTATALRAANASAATALRYTGVTLALLGTTCVARLEGDDSTLTWKPVRAHRPASGAGPARPPPRSKRSLPELASGNFSDEGSACSSEEDEEDDLAAAAGSLRLVNVRSVVAAQHTVTIRYDAAPGTLSTLVLRGSCTQAVAAALNEAAQSKRQWRNPRPERRRVGAKKHKETTLGGVARKACDRRAHRLVREVFYWWICSHPKCLD